MILLNAAVTRTRITTTMMLALVLGTVGVGVLVGGPGAPRRRRRRGRGVDRVAQLGGGAGLRPQRPTGQMRCGTVGLQPLTSRRIAVSCGLHKCLPWCRDH